MDMDLRLDLHDVSVKALFDDSLHCTSTQFDQLIESIGHWPLLCIS